MSHRFAPSVFAGILGTFVLVTTPSLSLADGPAHPHSINWRLQNQQRRIYHGIKQDQITRAEAKSLEREEWGIRQARYRMRHDDGYLGPQERDRLQHRLNESSQDIYAARHN